MSWAQALLQQSAFVMQLVPVWPHMATHTFAAQAFEQQSVLVAHAIPIAKQPASPACSTPRDRAPDGRPLRHRTYCDAGQ
jgi:hypothetical protein